MRLQVALLWSAVSLSLGCYTYVRSPEPVMAHADVELLLSTEGQLRLRDRVGLNTETLRGELVEADDATMLVAVPSTGPMEGLGTGPLFQRIDVPRADVLEVRTKAISAARTGALVGVIAGGVGVVLATQVFSDQNPGDAGNGDGGGPPEHLSGWVLGLPVVPR